MKTLLSIILLLGTLGCFAQTTALKGFAYGQAEAPTGKEWEAPEELALNKEQPRAWFFTFTRRGKCTACPARAQQLLSVVEW